MTVPIVMAWCLENPRQNKQRKIVTNGDPWGQADPRTYALANKETEVHELERFA